MSELETDMQQRLKFVLSQINDACKRRSKEFEGVIPRLVAVSKKRDSSDIIQAYQAGQRHFGENYVKELETKARDERILEKCKEIKWHFIGHLQGNKVKELLHIPYLYMIETVHSQQLAEKLNNSWDTGDDRKLRIFIQVNTSGEKEKSGCSPDEIINLMKFIKDKCPKLQVDGLMTIGSAEHSKESQNPDFVKLIECKKEVCREFGIPEKDFELSMGMSADYVQAIEMGSTNVRVGSAIFGERSK
ncbi:pyridoxal phosphate homeostasis protein [Coccinella septempunctata]|uniref:pyridoxal phosphate homeostasis protein n=1 Tax=Coccinella septempunctata TaxID=41139 RepID=UPI001D0776A4|nr:pyridoxal phosphate homeostasis protein [Coccinella septempunctata]